MAHIKCRYAREVGLYGEYELLEFEKTVKYYELDGHHNLKLKRDFIECDNIIYLEIDGRVLVNDI